MSDLEFDFGFTAVDTEQFTKETTVVSVPSTPVIAEVSAEQMTVIVKKIADLSAQITALKTASPIQMGRVEEKLDRILGMELQELSSTITQQGDSLGSVITEIEIRKTQIQNECKEKLQEAEKLILPLLANLMKNPEKEYIHWPHRSEKIQTHIDKITRCTRSFGV
jgi:hypothetical protein